MGGWVKLHRCLMNKAIWKTSSAEHKVILITLLMMANHKENEWEWQGRKFVCKPGQFITSAKSIAEKAGIGITRQNIRSALCKFENYEFLTKEATKTGMLVSIVNWEFYQSNEEEPTNLPTNSQPTANQQPTTNKNVKNTKNVKNLKEVYMANFDRFWSVYPKKINKESARKAWVKIKDTDDLIETMIQALEKAKASRDWQKEQGKFIPHPATWLNNKRWEDEIDGSYGTGQKSDEGGEYEGTLGVWF